MATAKCYLSFTQFHPGTCCFSDKLFPNTNSACLGETQITLYQCMRTVSSYCLSLGIVLHKHTFHRRPFRQTHSVCLGEIQITFLLSKQLIVSIFCSDIYIYCSSLYNCSYLSHVHACLLPYKTGRENACNCRYIYMYVSTVTW